MSDDSLDAARLFSRYGLMVYSRARRLLASHEDAEEATQEVFVRLLGSLNRLPPPEERALWLTRITTNYCLDRLREAQRRSRLLDTRYNVGPIDTAGEGGSDSTAFVRSLLARADERQAAAAIYVFVDGMSHDEAAEILGVSRRTVGNLVDRFTAWAREQGGEPATGVPS